MEIPSSFRFLRDSCGLFARKSDRQVNVIFSSAGRACRLSLCFSHIREFRHAALQELYKVRRPRRLVAANVFWSRSSNKSSWPQRNWVATTGGSQGESAWNGWGGVGSTCNAQTTILVDLVKGIKSLDIFSYIVSHSIKEILVPANRTWYRLPFHDPNLFTLDSNKL